MARRMSSDPTLRPAWTSRREARIAARAWRDSAARIPPPGRSGHAVAGVQHHQAHRDGHVRAAVSHSRTGGVFFRNVQMRLRDPWKTAKSERTPVEAEPTCSTAGRGHQQGGLAVQPQAIAQVDVLAIAEEPLVEAAQRQEQRPVDQAWSRRRPRTPRPRAGRASACADSRRGTGCRPRSWRRRPRPSPPAGRRSSAGWRRIARRDGAPRRRAAPPASRGWDRRRD